MIRKTVEIIAKGNQRTKILKTKQNNNKMLNFDQNLIRRRRIGTVHVLSQIEYEIHMRDNHDYIKELNKAFFAWGDKLTVNELSVTVSQPSRDILDRAKIKTHLMMQKYRPGQTFAIIQLYNEVVTRMEQKGLLRIEILNSVKFQTIHVSKNRSQNKNIIITF